MPKRKPGRKEEPVEESSAALEVLFEIVKGQDRATDIARKLKKDQSTVFRLLERLKKANYIKKKGPIYSVNEKALIDYFASFGIKKKILEDHFHIWFKEFGVLGKEVGAMRKNPALKDIVAYFKISEAIMEKYSDTIFGLFKAVGDTFSVLNKPEKKKK
jgi:predicted transcriptional regulator